MYFDVCIFDIGNFKYVIFFNFVLSALTFRVHKVWFINLICTYVITSVLTFNVITSQQSL